MTIQIDDRKISARCKLLGAAYLRALISQPTTIDIYISNTEPEWQDNASGHLPKMLKASIAEMYEPTVDINIFAIPTSPSCCPYGRYERPFWEQNQ